MTSSRIISLSAHAAFEFVIGLVALVAAFALGFSPAGTVIGVLAGAALIGLALTAAPDDQGRPALSVLTHHAADYGLALGLAGTALLLSFSGDRLAALVIAGIAVAQMALNVSTRYSARG